MQRENFDFVGRVVVGVIMLLVFALMIICYHSGQRNGFERGYSKCEVTWRRIADEEFTAAFNSGMKLVMEALPSEAGVVTVHAERILEMYEAIRDSIRGKYHRF